MRANVFYADALIVVFIESNLTWVWSDHIHHSILAKIPNLIVISKDKVKGRPGVVTTHDSKEAGVVRLREALAESSVRFAKEFISLNPKTEKNNIADQIRDYRNHAKPLTDLIFGTAKGVYSGKGPGKKDDCVLSLTQLLQLSITLRDNDPQFRDSVRAMGRAI